MEQVFQRRPKGLNRQQVLFLDAVETLVPAVHLFYQRMMHAALLHQSAVRLHEPTDGHELSLISDVVAFIGTVQRLRLVVKRLPGAPEVRVAKRAFESEIARYEPAGHHFEHLDERIPQIAASGHGVFGGISWQAPTDEGILISMLMPGTAAPAKSAVVTRAHNSVRFPVGHFYATIGGEPYYLTGAHDATLLLTDRLGAWSASLPADTTNDPAP